MKIKRFQAKNMRDAIRMVREEQGPDAVILSNHRTSEGVEVVAAVDYDAALLQQAQRQLAATPPPAPLFENRPQPKAQSQEPVRAAAAPELPRAERAITAPAAEKSADKSFSKSDDLSRVREELSGIRRLIEPLLPANFIQESRRQAPPNHAEGLDSLIGLGVEPELAHQVMNDLPRESTGERARFLPLALLAKRIPVCKTDAVMDGGIIALVGPTGVGKTTTLAKLAARYIQKNDPRDVALVSTDQYRIGAQEQLYTYGHLLGLPVHTAATAEALGKTLAKLAGRKLILIDTAGISQRDRKLAQQFLTLSSQSAPIRSYLVMSATSQASDLDEVVRKFNGIKPAGCILTKLDETTRTGGALSVIIRHQLPLAYLTDGQRVPEDLQLPRAERLVISAMQLARQAPAPEINQPPRHAGVIHAAV